MLTLYLMLQVQKNSLNFVKIKGDKMIELKCKTCGGTIRFKQGETIGVCDSCGTKKSLPRLDDEKIKTQFRKDKSVNEKTVRRKNLKKIAAVATPIVCVCIAFFILLTNVIIPNINRKAGYAKYGEVLKAANVGDTVLFGSYEQDNVTTNGKEDIEWNVLAKECDRLLLISKYTLDCKQYHMEQAGVAWEACSLRQWLNGTFLNDAFSAEEQSLIQDTYVSDDTNPVNATTDKVFLLSINEAEKYFGSDKDRKCVPTEYAKANGAYTDNRYTKNGVPTCWWWLRSPGILNNAARVYSDGSVDYYGNDVDDDSDCVRPAMWVSIK